MKAIILWKKKCKNAQHSFTPYDTKYHEICFYYLIKCNDNNLLNKENLFYITEGENEFEFRWIDVKDIQNEIVYPTFIKDKIQNLPLTIERIVDIDE